MNTFSPTPQHMSSAPTVTVFVMVLYTWSTDVLEAYPGKCFFHMNVLYKLQEPLLGEPPLLPAPQIHGNITQKADSRLLLFWTVQTTGMLLFLSLVATGA